jgi:hypothetical protein
VDDCRRCCSDFHHSDTVVVAMLEKSEGLFISIKHPDGGAYVSDRGIFEEPKRTTNTSALKQRNFVAVESKEKFKRLLLNRTMLTESFVKLYTDSTA